MNPKILLVDDDTSLLDGLERTLRKQFKLSTAPGGPEGLQKIVSDGPFALVVADMQMPGMSGLEFLRRVQFHSPETVRIMLTGNADQKTAVDAVNDGRVFSFLTKPCPAETLVPTLEAGLEQFRILQAERDLLANTLGGALKVLTEILSLNDPATFERGQRLRDLVREFAAATHFPLTWEIETAATLLSLGRVTIPAPVLEKVRLRESLSLTENELMLQIPEFGARLLESIPRLENVVAIIRYQQKNFDGTGAPGLPFKGVQIPIGARLLRIFADLLEQQASGHSLHLAWKTLRERSGCYDPEIFAVVAGFRAVRHETASSTLEEVAVDRLCPGDILVQDLMTSDGLILLAASTHLSPMLIVKLRNFQKLHSIKPTILIHR
jgi:response regulator RpfG family c-di-GMP phosphodiesterase